MDFEDYRAAIDFLELKGKKLMNHEVKDYATTGVPVNNFRILKKNGRTFYAIFSNVFKVIIEETLIKSCQEYPTNFGTGCAIDVLAAIYQLQPMNNFEWYKNFLKSEQFCFFVEIKNGRILDNALRLDLYRELKIGKNGKEEFIGGLFHVLKHFSYYGTPLSTGKELNDLQNIEQLIINLGIGFFFEKRDYINDSTYIVLYSISPVYNLKLVFYHEINSNVSFIKTIHLERKK